MGSVISAVLQKVLANIDWADLLKGVLSKLNLEQILTNLLKSFLDKYLQSKGLALSVDENDPDFQKALDEAVKTL